jgi:predicted nuclease of predicted toxin-antitoxin system
MRFLIDAQLCGWFGEHGHTATHVSDELGGQTPDRDIAAYVEEHKLVLVTKDDNFLLRHPSVRSRLVWLRCGNIGNRGLRVWLEPRWLAVESRLREGEAVVEVR